MENTQEIADHVDSSNVNTMHTNLTISPVSSSVVRSRKVNMHQASNKSMTENNREVIKVRKESIALPTNAEASKSIKDYFNESMEAIGWQLMVRATDSLLRIRQQLCPFLCWKN